MAHERLRPQFIFDEEKIKQLKQLAPECFEDGKINFETLRQNLGDWAQDDEEKDLEHFGLFWPGKRDARRAASLPPQGTLEPVYGEGLKADGTPDTDGVNDSKNIFIEGENLEVLKILQKSYAGKIKMIYIDPPYNTGNDFVYDDDFTEPLQEYLRRTGQVDEEGKPLTTNKRSDGRFHSKWLSMMYPRLRLARNLMKKDGIIFVSIDENEVHHLYLIMSEIFGAENYAGEIVWQNSSKNDQDYISIQHEYILCFVKDKNENKGEWTERKAGLDEIYRAFEAFRKKYGNDWDGIHKAALEWYKQFPESNPIYGSKHYSWMDERGVYFPDNISGPNFGQYRYDVIHPITGKVCKEPSSGWRFPEKTMLQRIKDNLVHFGKDETTVPNNKTYLKDTENQSLTSVKYRDGRVASKNLNNLLGGKYFTNPKDPEILMQLFRAVKVKEDDIILDFFAGSGSTAEAVQNLNEEDNGNRTFICVQFPEKIDEKEEAFKAGYKTISEITKARIKRTLEKSAKKNKGVRLYKLVNTSFKQWTNYNGQSVGELVRDLDLFNQQPLRDEWTNDRLLSEVLLLEGFVLSASIEPFTQLQKNKIFIVRDDYCEHSLFLCFDKSVDKATVESIKLTGNDIFICLDSSISNVDKLRLSDKGLIKTI